MSDYVTIFKAHERIVLTAVIGVILYTGIGRIDTALIHHDQANLAQAQIAVQKDATNVQQVATTVQKQATDYQALASRLQTENAQLKQQNAQLAATLPSVTPTEQIVDLKTASSISRRCVPTASEHRRAESPTAAT
jgi:hypothetical protein